MKTQLLIGKKVSLVLGGFFELKGDPKYRETLTGMIEDISNWERGNLLVVQMDKPVSDYRGMSQFTHIVVSCRHSGDDAIREISRGILDADFSGINLSEHEKYDSNCSGKPLCFGSIQLVK